MSTKTNDSDDSINKRKSLAAAGGHQPKKQKSIEDYFGGSREERSNLNVQKSSTPSTSSTSIPRRTSPRKKSSTSTTKTTTNSLKPRPLQNLVRVPTTAPHRKAQQQPIIYRKYPLNQPDHSGAAPSIAIATLSDGGGDADRLNSTAKKSPAKSPFKKSTAVSRSCKQKQPELSTYKNSIEMAAAAESEKVENEIELDDRPGPSPSISTAAENESDLLRKDAEHPADRYFLQPSTPSPILSVVPETPEKMKKQNDKIAASSQNEMKSIDNKSDGEENEAKISLRLQETAVVAPSASESSPPATKSSPKKAASKSPPSPSSVKLRTIQDCRKKPGKETRGQEDQQSGGLPPLKSTNQHKVLVKPSTIFCGGGQRSKFNESPPLPYPTEFVDSWDNNHVKMPCSAQSKYAEKAAGGDGGKEEEEAVVNRWDIITKALLTPFKSSHDIGKAIKTYNQRLSCRFPGLHSFFYEFCTQAEAREYIEVAQRVAALALRLPKLCTQPIPLLRRKQNCAVTLSQEQCACLLANAFFCTFPRRNARGPNSEYADYPSINFTSLLAIDDEVNMEKLKCIFHYFSRITSSMPIGTVTFERRGRPTFPDWSETSQQQLAELVARAEGTIEDDSDGMSQMDFANKYLGGGVLGHGAVQEEIRFMMCPELILSCLFTEVLMANECLVMTGAERFSAYTGYSGTFAWSGDFVERVGRDEWGRYEVEVIAIDAVCFGSHNIQFIPKYVDRELNKAWIGFLPQSVTTASTNINNKTSDEKEDECLPKSYPIAPALATGHWGCGAFGGDKELKSLIQLTASSMVQRQLLYFTFGETDFQERLVAVHDRLRRQRITVSGLYELILEYYNVHVRSMKRAKPSVGLFQFIESILK